MKLSHTEWKLGTRHEYNLGYQFSRAWNDSGFVSCQTVQRLFPTLLSFASSKQKKKKEGRKKKSVSSFDSSISGSGWFFLFFPFLVVKFLWWLWLKCCCIVVLQTNGIQCVKKVCMRYTLLPTILRNESQFHVTVWYQFNTVCLLYFSGWWPQS